MKRNIASWDKAARIIFALIVLILFLTNAIGGTTAIVLGIVAVVLLVTAFINFCPLYAIFGINTFKKKE